LDEEILRKRILPYSITLVCSKCGRDIKLGEFIIRKRRKLYHQKCFNSMQIDVPDTILDEEELFFIEHGYFPSTISPAVTISDHAINTIPVI
jgi:hypothetical protein